jgi:hypothetical protein
MVAAEAGGFGVGGGLDGNGGSAVDIDDITYLIGFLVLCYFIISYLDVICCNSCESLFFIIMNIMISPI